MGFRKVLYFNGGGGGIVQRPVYIAIDLKSYYASVECVERGKTL